MLFIVIKGRGAVSTKKLCEWLAILKWNNEDVTKKCVLSKYTQTGYSIKKSSCQSGLVWFTLCGTKWRHLFILQHKLTWVFCKKQKKN